MPVKGSGQFSFVDALVSRELGRSDVLERLSGLVKWYRFEKLLRVVRHEGGPGRPGYQPVELFKGLLLQSLYGLSDAELEYALHDRLSFRRFVGLGLEDSVPDHTTYCRFRNLLMTEGLLEKLFAELDRQLELAGVVLKRGTMLDATVIQADARPGSDKQPSADPDAKLLRRPGKAGTTFGYKAHVGVDQGSGLIRAVCTTPANVNDTTPADQLIRGDERQVLGDKAYHTHARERALLERGIKPLLMRRANKHHPLPDRLKRLNRQIAKQRAAVETTFATMKRRMGLRVRYRGLAKVAGQILLASIAFNMRRWVALSR